MNQLWKRKSGQTRFRISNYHCLFNYRLFNVSYTGKVLLIWINSVFFFFFLMPFIVYLLPCCSAHACIKEHTQICFCFHPNRCLISTSQASFLLKVTMRQALAYLFPLWAASHFRLTVQKQPGSLHPSMLFLPLCTL